MGLDHVNRLAEPKVCHQTVFHRPTVYWVDKIPTEHHRVTVPVLTPRQEELSQFKKVNPAFQADRTGEERYVSRAALKAKATPRLKVLAKPHTCTDPWEINRPLYLVSKGAMAAVPSERINLLAKPREPPATPSKLPRKPVHGGVFRAARFDELSKPRTYVLDARNPYKVSTGALQYVPSPRVLEISRPARGKVA